MKAIIMAGGKGTRINSLFPDIPKPMIPINGKPILQWQIENLKQNRITDIIIITGYKGDIIQNYFKNGQQFNVNITYIQERNPLGTAGSLFYFKDAVEDFLLIYGDLIFDIDFNSFIAFHKQNNAYATLFTHPNSHPQDSDLIIVNKQNQIIQIKNKNEPTNTYFHNLTNAGIYCINPKLLSQTKLTKLNLETDIIQPWLISNKIYSYHSTEYVKDAGIPNRLLQVESDLKTGIVKAKNLQKKQKAIFLDRDGTINQYKDYITNPEQLDLLPKASEAIKIINNSPYLAIVITNQPSISFGDISFQDLNIIHNKMEILLGKDGAYLDDIYFCPHHPDRGFPGEIVSLKYKCNCRKPNIGMLLQASEQHNIDLTQSWFIGDTEKDIQTGINANVKTIHVLTGATTTPSKNATYVASNLLEAVRRII